MSSSRPAPFSISRFQLAPRLDPKGSRRHPALTTLSIRKSPSPGVAARPRGVNNGGVNRILVATDRSKTADRAVRFAAALADRYGSELLILQVLLPQNEPATEAGAAEATRVGFASEELQKFAREVAGPRGQARVVIDTDPSRAILQTIDQADVDAVVVGNVGMAGRREFLLGNIPNRISHNAQCTVIIVNTAALGDGKAPLP